MQRANCDVPCRITNGTSSLSTIVVAAECDAAHRSQHKRSRHHCIMDSGHCRSFLYAFLDSFCAELWRCWWRPVLTVAGVRLPIYSEKTMSAHKDRRTFHGKPSHLPADSSCVRIAPPAAASAGQLLTVAGAERLAEAREFDIFGTTSLKSDVPMPYFSWQEYGFLSPLPNKVLLLAAVRLCGLHRRRS
jgi:hypothetical protein